MITNTEHLGDGSFYVTYTHSTTENMKHGVNTCDRQNMHAEALNYKQTQGQNINAPPTFKSAEQSSQSEPT